MVLAWTGDELSRGQAQNGLIFYFEVKFDLEGQGQSPPKTIGILTKVFYTYGPNLVILAWEQVMRYCADKHVITVHTDGRMDRQTDAGNDNTWRPKLALGKNDYKTSQQIKVLHMNKMLQPVTHFQTSFSVRIQLVCLMAKSQRKHTLRTPLSID